MDKANLMDFMRKLRIEIVHESDSGWLTGHCPFAKWLHVGKEDNRPSFFVRADVRKKSGYNCYSCHKSGNIVNLIKALAHYRKREYPGLDIEAQIAEVRAGVSFEYSTDIDDEEPEPIPEEVFAGFFRDALRSKASRAYLRNERMISDETTELLGLLYDPEERRILFPVRGRRNELYGFSGRTMLPKEKWPFKGYGKIRDYHGLAKKWLILGANLIDLNKPMIAVEGLFAFAALYEEGCDRLGNPVGTLGSTCSPQQCAKFIEWGKPIYGFYDNDKAGRRGMLGYKDQEGTFRNGMAQNLANDLPVFVPSWPEGLSDPDELVFKDVQRMVRKAKLFVPREEEKPKKRTSWETW